MEFNSVKALYDEWIPRWNSLNKKGQKQVTKYYNYLKCKSCNFLRLPDENRCFECKNFKRHYVYLLKARCFIDSDEQIYKVGRTCQESLSRFKNYSKGSCIILHFLVSDSVEAEKEIIQKFKEEFIFRDDHGIEYFEGDLGEMINLFANIILQNHLPFSIKNKRSLSEDRRLLSEEKLSDLENALRIKEDAQKKLVQFFEQYKLIDDWENATTQKWRAEWTNTISIYEDYQKFVKNPLSCKGFDMIRNKFLTERPPKGKPKCHFIEGVKRTYIPYRKIENQI